MSPQKWFTYQNLQVFMRKILILDFYFIQGSQQPAQKKKIPDFSMWLFPDFKVPILL